MVVVSSCAPAKLQALILLFKLANVPIGSWRMFEPLSWWKTFLSPFVILVALAQCCLAHTTGLSTSVLTFGTNGLDAEVVFAAADLTLVLTNLDKTSPFDANHDGKLSDEEITVGLERLRKFAAGALLIEFDGRPIQPGPVDFVLDATNNFHMEMSFRGQRPTRLRVRAALFQELPPDHYHFVSVHENKPEGPLLGEKMLKPTDDSFDLTLVASSAGTSGATKTAPPVSTFSDFLKLGMMHIWTGNEHLLFLLALMLVCSTFKSAIQVISFFTVANTVALALAVLNLVLVAVSLVELAIAASIVYVSVENFFRPSDPKGRWKVTFFFGLVHGLGFATALRSLGIASTTRGIVVPLVGFNLGVEGGQIVIALAILPIIWKLRKSERFVRLGVPACSAVLAAAGAYWMIQRLLFR